MSGLTDERNESVNEEISLAIHTPAGPITSRPMVETDHYLGFWTDWLVDGEHIALATSEYQTEEKVFVTHEYADFSEDSPTRSITHYFNKEGESNAESVLCLLRPES